MKAVSIEVKKINRSFCVVSGAAVLGKFRTEAAANASMSADAELYAYWAGSVGASVQNAEHVVVVL